MKKMYSNLFIVWLINLIKEKNGVIILCMSVMLFSFLGSSYMYYDVCFAEEPIKKTYEELEKELNMYKNVQMCETAFRTIDVIFGLNNSFSQAGHLCDNFINFLNAYYMWTLCKWSLVMGVSLYVGYFIGFAYGMLDSVDTINFVETLKSMPDSSFPITDKNKLFELIINNLKKYED